MIKIWFLRYISGKRLTHNILLLFKYNSIHNTYITLSLKVWREYLFINKGGLILGKNHIFLYWKDPWKILIPPPPCYVPR